MNIESPIALQFIMQDELYLLNNDKKLFGNMALPVAESVPVEDIAPMTAGPQADFTYLGDGAMDFVVLVHYPELEFIAESHLTALENILRRKGMAINDVAIVNMARYNTTTLKHLTDRFKPKRMLFLGEKALPLAIAPLKLNHLQQLDSCKALYSFSFEEMMDDNELKKTFWEQMKYL